MINECAEQVSVVDSFYDDPMAVRDFALACSYVKAWGSWSGLHSLERAPDTKSQLFKIAAMMSDRTPNWDELDASYSFWKKASCGGFAAMFDQQEGIIHAHRRSGDWAAVVYLSSEESCRGRNGTIFYRHRKTGLDHYTDESDPAFQQALADARNPRAWEPIRFVPMQFNRLVLFDSRMFHGASSGFGNDIASSRLIQVFNFTFID